MILLTTILIIVFGTTDPALVVLSAAGDIGLWMILKKSGVTPWYAFVPCLREYTTGRCAGREVEGRGYAILQLFQTLLVLVEEYIAFFRGTPSSSVFFTLLMFTITIVDLIYMARVFAGLVEVYGRSRRWIIAWLVVPAIPSLVFGFSKKFQPRWTVADMEKEAKLVLSGARAEVLKEGLTVNLEERTVKEFFQKKYLLRDIHMTIQPGHMVLLLGGSGAGKTTFLNAVNGYEKATAQVVLNGQDVYKQYKQMQYEVGFVPQQELMRGKDTVYRTLMDAALLRLPSDVSEEGRKERVRYVMDLFGLTPVERNLVEKLSGGQKKRLSIAMEFVSNPSLFILDEPDSGLDGVMARELMEQLRAIADAGSIVIVITHTPDRVIDLFDDVIVLAKDTNRTGRLAFFGTIDEARAFFGKQSMEQIVMTVNRPEEGGEGRADEFVMKYAEAQHV